jgi:hypothetical protein
MFDWGFRYSDKLAFKELRRSESFGAMVKQFSKPRNRTLKKNKKADFCWLFQV